MVITWPERAWNRTESENGAAEPPAARQQKLPTADAEPRARTSTRRFSSPPVLFPPTVTGGDTAEPDAGTARGSGGAAGPTTAQGTDWPEPQGTRGRGAAAGNRPGG